MTLLDKVWEDQEKEEAMVLSLRDFSPDDKELKEFFMDQGFITLDIPDGHIIDNLSWTGNEGFLQSIDRDKKYYVRKRALDYEHRFEVNIVNQASADEINHYFRLYKNVSAKSYEIIGFDLHKAFFENVIKHPQWELLEIKLKPEFDRRPDRDAVAMAISYKTKDNYCFLVTGIDYNYLEQHHVYAQALWQTIKRANELGLKTINMGITASQNKRKFGAKVIKNVMYVQTKDSFNASVIATIANKEMKMVD